MTCTRVKVERNKPHVETSGTIGVTLNHGKDVVDGCDHQCISV